MTAKKYLKKLGGFTLVELLVVIAILAIIIIIVIAAINPIEMVNRARDTGMEADARELTEAVNRFYAPEGVYPWELNTTLTADSILQWRSAQDALVGLNVCGTWGAAPITTCATTTIGTAGNLITRDQLKTTHLTRDWNRSTAGIRSHLFVGKPTGASSTVSACFIPTSKSMRQSFCDSGNVWQLMTNGAKGNGTTAGTPVAATGCEANPTPDANWLLTTLAFQAAPNPLTLNGTTAQNFVCIP